MSSTGNKNWKQIGEDAWKRCEKINGDLFTLTYGSLVSQLLSDDPTTVNAQLDRLGHSLGCRLIDEFLARTSSRCGDFREAGEAVKAAFRMFLNLGVGVEGDGKEWVVTMEGEGLGGEWVELPEGAIKEGVHYANLFCGVIRGALEMVNMLVECTITSDPLLNPSQTNTEIRVKLVKYIEEEMPPGDE